MSLSAIALYAAAVVIAGILRGFTGFGFALAAVPLASLVLPPQEVVVATLLILVAGGVRDIFGGFGPADRRAVLLLSLGAVAGTPLGVLLLTDLPVPWVRIALGAITLATVAVSLRRPALLQGGAWWQALLAGLASGVCTGLAAMPGPPVVVYFMLFEPRPAVMRASMLMFFPIAGLAALPSAFASGLIDRDSLILGAIGFPLMLLGSRVGAAGFRRFGDGAYRPAATAALVLTALAALAKGVAELR